MSWVLKCNQTSNSCSCLHVSISLLHFSHKALIFVINKPIRWSYHCLYSVKVASPCDLGWRRCEFDRNPWLAEILQKQLRINLDCIFIDFDRKIAVNLTTLLYLLKFSLHISVPPLIVLFISSTLTSVFAVLMSLFLIHILRSKPHFI
jgi:hypothetical protein